MLFLLSPSLHAITLVRPPSRHHSKIFRTYNLSAFSCGYFQDLSQRNCHCDRFVTLFAPCGFLALPQFSRASAASVLRGSDSRHSLNRFGDYGVTSLPEIKTRGLKGAATKYASSR